MGLLDWSGVGDWFVNAASNVAEVAVQVAAPVVGGVTNGLQVLGADVSAEWAETRLDKQLEIGGAIVGGVYNAGEATIRVHNDTVVGGTATLFCDDKDYFEIYMKKLYISAMKMVKLPLMKPANK